MLFLIVIKPRLRFVRVLVIGVLRHDLNFIGVGTIDRKNLRRRIVNFYRNIGHLIGVIRGEAVLEFVVVLSFRQGRQTRLDVVSIYFHGFRRIHFAVPLHFGEYFHLGFF